MSRLDIQPDMSNLRQGDIVEVSHIPLIGQESEQAIDSGQAVVITQTCDLVRDTPPTATVAALTRLKSDQASEARLGRRPSYVHVPRGGDCAFADLTYVATIAKSELLKLQRQRGVDESDDKEVRDFAKRIGRRYSRFAFPDQVSSQIKPLQDLIRSRARQEKSPLAKCLECVTEFRLEAIDGWSASTSYDLVLLVIVEPGTLPNSDPDMDNSSDLIAWCQAKRPAEIAEKLITTNQPEAKLVLWYELAASFARECRAEDGDSVRSLSAEVLSEDELPYSRVLRSELIDVEHLSPALPL